MSIYTRSGDAGETSLVGGSRVSKDHPRVCAYGTIDELSSSLGVVRALIDTKNAGGARLSADIIEIQHQLFELSVILASPENTETCPSDQALEELIRSYSEGVPPLKRFLLPGGGPASGFLHQARTICRRAERESLKIDSLDPAVLRYENRLSDLLFVMARWAAWTFGEEELLFTRSR